nr:alpha/beta fold hydrolase [Agromyces seonyuensis]
MSVSGWLSHLETGWSIPEERAFQLALGEGCRSVRYDRAGCGLSDPLPDPPSIDGELRQLDALAGLLGPEPFDLFGSSLGAPVAVAWAAEHPERVRRLVLSGGWVRGGDLAPPDVREHLLGLVGAHWGLGADVLTDVFAPDASAALRARVGRYQRDSSDADTAVGLLALGYRLDVSDVLGRVRAPTLVVHREHDRAAPLSGGVALAAGILDAELVVLPGRSHLPFVGDTAALLAPIRRFLGLRAPVRDALGLTSRQREVAALVGAGCTNREIGLRLGIAERSAEGHVERIRDRLGFRTRSEIAAWYAAETDSTASGQVG